MIAISLKGDDELKWVEASQGDDQIMLSTENGQAIRFSEKDVRPMGRTASGVTGMRLKKDDKIISSLTALIKRDMSLAYTLIQKLLVD
jgi:DNA gyrase subunit A